MVSQNIFRRYELKYLVTKEQKARVLEAMSPRMQPDQYGRSAICNLYFDTPDYLLVRRSLEQPVYKEKLRLRSYGPVREDDTVFIELKKKYKGVVYKRRVEAGQREAMEYLGGDASPGAALLPDNQILREIDYFKTIYKGLAPRVYLAYEREAFYGREDTELRITFDENILWREDVLSLCSKPYGSPILQPGLSLMEIKTTGSIPLWLCRVLSDQGIYKTGFSKYGIAYTQIAKYEEEQNKIAGSGGRKYA